MFDEETRSSGPRSRACPSSVPSPTAAASCRSSPVVTTTWGEWRREHPNDDGAVARHRIRARLLGGRRLPRLLRHRPADVRQCPRRRAAEEQGRRCSCFAQSCSAVPPTAIAVARLGATRCSHSKPAGDRWSSSPRRPARTRSTTVAPTRSHLDCLTGRQRRNGASLDRHRRRTRGSGGRGWRVSLHIARSGSDGSPSVPTPC